jgi:hypothetical protein
MRFIYNFKNDCFPSFLLYAFAIIFLVKVLYSYKNIPYTNIIIVLAIIGIAHEFIKFICKKNTITYWLLIPIPFLLFGYILYDFNNNIELKK